MSKVNKELLACLNKAGHLTSQLEEVLGEAEMLCREDSSIPQELWQVIEEHEVASLESLIVVDSPSTLCPVSSETMERSQFRAWGGGVLPTLDVRG